VIGSGNAAAGELMRAPSWATRPGVDTCDAVIIAPRRRTCAANLLDELGGLMLPPGLRGDLAGMD